MAENVEWKDKIMNIGLIGAGAVGAYFIWGFQNSESVKVTVLAEGERKERLSRGIRINNEVYTPDVRSSKENVKYDLILVATKYSGLGEAIEMLRHCSDETTIILSLLNGVDSEEKICAAGIKGILVPSVMRIASRRDAFGIYFEPEKTQGVYFGVGKHSDHKVEEAVKKVAAIFSASQIRYTVLDDIDTDIWVKYASNIANNLPQAVLGTDASLYTDSEHGYFLATKLWEEVRAVAKTRGISLSEEPLIFTSVPKTSKYSTLQDLENMCHTEIDMFAGYLMEMAQEAGISVPFTEYTFHAIKALEEKNDGKIGK